MPDLVRVRITTPSGEVVEKNEGRAFAETQGFEVLDEPTLTPANNLRPTTRKDGRPANKRKTTVDQAAADKKAAGQSAPAESSKE